MFGKDTKVLNAYITNGSMSVQDANLVWSAAMIKNIRPDFCVYDH